MSSQLIEQACKRSKKKAFNFSFSDLSSGQKYTFFYSTNTSHAWNELKEEGGQGGAHEGAARKSGCLFGVVPNQYLLSLVGQGYTLLFL